MTHLKNYFIPFFLLLFTAMAASGDTIDYYKVYYNSKLIYQSDINHCNRSYYDSINVYHFNRGVPDEVHLDRIDDDAVFRIDYYRDYFGQDDTMFLELADDTGRVLKSFAIPCDPRESKVMSIEGSRIKTVLKENNLNCFVFVYWDRLFIEETKSYKEYLESQGITNVGFENYKLNLVKVIVRKL